MENNRYVLNVGAPDDERLMISNAIYGPESLRFLTSLGLRKGQRVLEIGCGTGNVTAWIAKQVGAAGSVTAVDISTEQLEVARKKIEVNGFQNVDFVADSAESLEAVRGEFDLVYCRFLLIHLQNPVAALKKMKSKLAKGGVLACEEPTTSTHLCYPHSPAFERANELTIKLGAERHFDFNIGLRLYELFRQLDLESPTVQFSQPVIAKAAHRRIFPMSLQQTKPKIIELGLATEAEVDAILHELWRLCEDESFLVAGFRNTHASGAKR